MKKEIAAGVVIILSFALIQTIKLGGWNSNDMAPVLVQANDATFRDKLEESGEWTLVKFWAPWCDACRRLMPTVTEIAREERARLTVIAVNVDEAPATASRFRVEPIPCLVLLQEGHEVARMVGVQPKPVLTTWIEGTISRASTDW
jgi:thioredoxin